MKKPRASPVPAVRSLLPDCYVPSVKRIPVFSRPGFVKMEWLPEEKGEKRKGSRSSANSKTVTNARQRGAKTCHFPERGENEIDDEAISRRVF